MPYTKKCSKCLCVLPVESFFRDRSKPNGRHPACKECQRPVKAVEQSNRNARRRHEDPEGARRRTKANHCRSYGLSIEDFEAMRTAQDNKCLICRRPEMKRHQNGSLCELSIDHDHATGKVRGLLCSSCNLVLGKMNDDPDLLEAAAAYLRNSAT